MTTVGIQSYHLPDQPKAQHGLLGGIEHPVSHVVLRLAEKQKEEGKEAEEKESKADYVDGELCVDGQMILT